MVIHKNRVNFLAHSDCMVDTYHSDDMVEFLYCKIDFLVFLNCITDTCPS
jgi:hypothetical protein